MIGRIVLTMLIAAAKINQSSIVPAFDQTRVPRIIQVPSSAANFIIALVLSFVFSLNFIRSLFWLLHRDVSNAKALVYPVL